MECKNQEQFDGYAKPLCSENDLQDLLAPPQCLAYSKINKSLYKQVLFRNLRSKGWQSAKLRWNQSNLAWKPKNHLSFKNLSSKSKSIIKDELCSFIILWRN